MRAESALRRVRRLVICLAVLLLLPLVALAQTGTVTASSLNVRKSASTSADIVKVLKKGATVTIQSTSGSWYKIKYGSVTGYVAKKYISVSSSSSSKSSSSSSSSSSKSTSSSSSSTKASSLAAIGKPSACKPGDKGSNVKKLQQCLQYLGYYSGKIDGDYGSGTTSAVKKFQKAKGLTADGIAGKNTISVMFGGSVSNTSSSSSSGKLVTERLDWFKNGVRRIPKGATFTVKDVKTGKTFTCKRWSGANHMDSEPLTKADTAVLKSLYGGHFSWKRRAILVKYDGHVYAASMNGMPHGTGTIKNNNFDGHFCIHFYGSKTHGTKRVDKTHQNCVATAMKYSW